MASGVNNAIARVAGLVAIAGVGAVVAASYGSSLEEKLGALADRPELSGRAGRRQARAAGAGSRRRAAACGFAPRVEQAAIDASVEAFRLGVGIAAVLVALGGIVGLIGIQNPRRRVEAAACPGGQLAGVPEEGARQSPCDWGREQLESPAPA